MLQAQQLGRDGRKLRFEDNPAMGMARPLADAVRQSVATGTHALIFCCSCQLKSGAGRGNNEPGLGIQRIFVRYPVDTFQVCAGHRVVQRHQTLVAELPPICLDDALGFEGNVSSADLTIQNGNYDV